MKRIDIFSELGEPQSPREKARGELAVLAFIVGLYIVSWFVSPLVVPSVLEEPIGLRIVGTAVYGLAALMAGCLAFAIVYGGGGWIVHTLRDAFGRPERLLPAPRHINQQSLAEWRAYLRADETDIIDSDEGK